MIHLYKVHKVCKIRWYGWEIHTDVVKLEGMASVYLGWWLSLGAGEWEEDGIMENW